MDKRIHLNLFYFFFFLLSSFTVSLAQTSTLKTPDLLTKSSPFSPKSSLIRYWKTQISNNLSIPSFLLSKASPLPPLEYSLFTKLASNHSLSSHLSSFCSSADLFCFSDSSSPESRHTKDTNFAVYGPKTFSNYGGGVTFKNYSENTNFAASAFARYSGANNTKNDFRAYGGNGGNAGSDTFTSYRDRANSGTDTFTSYGKKSNSGKTNFVNYGKSFNPGSDSFREYGKGSTGQSQTGFSIYSMNSTFKEYTKTGVTFGQYTKPGSNTKPNGGLVNKWVEPVKFFREKMLKKGSIVKMPDIVDKMPKRSFLPRAITSKLPFATGKLSDVKEIFQARDQTVLDRVLTNTLTECERAPSRGETKRCVGSIEDMVDFAVSVLGHDLVVRTTENVMGSKKEVMIGEVKGINGGKITKSVSCHQSLYPYLLYYCHSVPKVRVYVAEILDVSSKAKINSGVAICHIDTSAWSPGHGAFVALGYGPGRIEVCHWIFENEMTWTTSD